MVPDLAIDGVAISLAERLDDGRTVAVQWSPSMLIVAELEEGERAPVALVLQDDCARALFKALAFHYGTAPASAARLEHLCERVDRLLDHLDRRPWWRRAVARLTRH